MLGARGATVDDRGELPAADQGIVGRRLGDFVVQAVVDAGAGVYRAAQQSLAREAIIKVLPAGQPPAASLVERFLLETQLAARLDHPYGAHIYAFGAEADGLLWIAMELVRGTPLDVFVVENGPMSPERFAPFLQRLAEVIDAAHEVGIIHRDIKPANVMALSRAGALFPKLLDFGVAAIAGDARGETTGKRVIGSPHYMAPEQWAGSPASASDLYSLAILSFEVLSGRVPFDGETLDAIATAHERSPVPLLVPDRPSRLDEVLARALAKQPGDRHPTAQAFAEAVRAVTVRTTTKLPQLPDALRDTCLVRAPRPIAEAVADLAGSSHPHEALDALWHLASVAIRVSGIITLAARLALRAARDDVSDRELLLTLRRRALSDAEWLALARLLAGHHAVYRDAYPVPELLDVLGDPTPFTELLALRATASHPSEERARELLGRGIPLAAAMLESLRFLEEVPLVVGRGGAAEERMGLDRGRSPILPMAHPPAEGCAALASREGVILLELSPLVQVQRPHASAVEELFLLEGGQGEIARLVAPRAGFEITDSTLWQRIEHLMRVDVDGAAGEVSAEERSPYLGLASFTAEDAPSYVGREREVETFLNRLRVQSFVGLIGPSGAGKSSFIGAGVIPSLPDGWRAVVTRPGAAPLEALEARLLREGLSDGEVRALLEGKPPGRASDHLVIVIDQFEELFTLCPHEVVRARFADTLARLARSVEEPVRVVIAVRDDFLVRVEQLPALRDRLAQGFHLLSTPSPTDLERILVEPARRAGYEFDDASLPAQMAAEVADLPGALALLSFTAWQLWEQRDRYFRRLTRRAYEAMDGVGGALAQHAEATLALMTTPERELVRGVFRRMVTSEGTRAVVERAEVTQSLGDARSGEAVLDRLIERRILVASNDELGGDKLEVIHEALLAAWPRLVAWRREDSEGSRLREQLRAAAEQWRKRGRPRGLLWRDDALAEYRAWRTRFPVALSEGEAAFAETSLAAERASRVRRRLVIAVALAILAGGILVLALSERRAGENARHAELQVALLHEEKGREALQSGDPMRAIVHLAEAMRRGRDGAALRHMVGAVSRELSSEVFALDQGVRLWDGRFSPDGSVIATGGDAGTLRLWDAATGTLLRALPAGSAAIKVLAFSPDGVGSSRVAPTATPASGTSGPGRSSGSSRATGASSTTFTSSPGASG